MLNLLIYAIFIVSSLVNFMQADVGIKLFIDLEDPTITTDLRALNSSSERTKYDRFWEECDAVLNEEVDTAVDD